MPGKLAPGVFPNYERALLTITYQVPSMRYIKDDDNAIICAKAAIDGCVLAGIIVDDSPDKLQILRIVWDVGKKDKATILEFSER